MARKKESKPTPGRQDKTGEKALEATRLADYGQPGDPVAFVIFGGAGDLTWRKLIPALFDIYLDGSMPESFTIVAVDAADSNEEQLHQRLRDGAQRFCQHPVRDNDWRGFEERISYLKADFNDAESYSRLAGRLKEFAGSLREEAVNIFYMATPPRFFGTIAEALGKAGLARNKKPPRIVVEKPIGHDLKSTLALNKIITGAFDESQIYRIDHFLGKETVRNILAFRFANPLFEPIWDRRYVDYVMITVAEQLGVEHRGSYYESAGALRDMIQNHLMQLLCMIAMEPPVSFDADELRNKKVDVLHAVRAIAPGEVDENATRGQYGPGTINGEEVPGYRQEPGVAPDSNTETFAALRLFIDNWRWQNVPFYLRTGKRLDRQASEIAIHFHPVPHQSFPPEAATDWSPAALILCIQPSEGIVLRFQAKKPGPRMFLQQARMHFGYEEGFGGTPLPPPDAYKTLLWDLMVGDATIFMRADQVEAAWSILTPILDAWQNQAPKDFPNYPSGSWGPEGAEAMVARQGCSWAAALSTAGEEPGKCT